MNNDLGIRLPLKDIKKQQANEENTKLNYITPVLLEKWKNPKNVIMEYQFTDGRIVVDEKSITRKEAKKADYVLLHKENIPLAIVEAKGIEHSAEEGYQQAVEYATILDVPFAYLTNGKDLIERDMLTGKNRTLQLKDFPTPKELWYRYQNEKGITDKEESILIHPYHTALNGRNPRYYQRIAINRTVEAIAAGQDRILLVMATGTGKTYTAFQIIYRFWSMREKKKILFLADRNILVDQTMRNDFKPFEQARVMTKIDGKAIKTSYEVYLSLYQQLKSADKNYYTQFPSDFFDLIVVDECHRGSASDESSWREILDYFSSATQIGLTATPKETEDTSNIAYFGEPVYTYSLKQGIEDGFLAPYRVISVELDIDKSGYVAPEGTVDNNGNSVAGKLFLQKDFDRSIVVDERRKVVAKRITEYLKSSGNRYMKTIVFCEDISHAQAMQRLLENENSDLVAENPKYIVRITGDDEFGKSQLDNFIAPASKYPCIAITSKLMGTGVDSQTTELIVLDRCIGSMTEFKQIVGRGTRIKEEYQLEGEETIRNKSHFTILDFRKNYLKFSDPQFDGEPTSVLNVGETGEFPDTSNNAPKEPNDGDEEELQMPRGVVHVNGVEVEIVEETVQYLDEHGRLIKQNLESCIRNNIVTQFPTDADFKMAWLESNNKTLLAESLLIDKDFVRNYEHEFGSNIDKFDIIRNIAYGVSPKSKIERIELVKSNGILIPYLNEKGTQLIEQLFTTYLITDMESLKDVKLFDMPQFSALGWSPVKAVRFFGNKQKYLNLLGEIEKIMYEGE